MSAILAEPVTDGAPRIFARALRSLLSSQQELAVLDVREALVHSRDGHILLSVPLPLGRLELLAPSIVPRLDTRIVVYDAGGEGLAERAAARLAELGYSDVSILDGGVGAWEAAGYEIFTGSGALSKGFGEFVEHHYGTPHLSAVELKHKLDAGEDVVVLDSRTLPEFDNFAIPGGIPLPGAELVYRVHDLVPSPDTLVVVNCAGRTRSIIGAQALINAGLPNKVVSLENGTMAWLLEGFALAEGNRGSLAEPSAAAREKARQSAERLRQRFGLRPIDLPTLAHFRADPRRSLYLFDVRTAEEYRAGHLAGSHWAEGGQLVQGIDQWVGTRNARIVLVDDGDLVRAAITASWLVQIGWGEVFILEGGLDGALERGPEQLRLAAIPPPVPLVAPASAAAAVANGQAIVVDIDLSSAYRAGHIAGAWFGLRSRLAESLHRLPSEPAILLASANGDLARFAAAELKAEFGNRIEVIEGGTDAWRKAGLPLESGGDRWLDPAEDLWTTPYAAADRFAAFRDYLDWEIGLVAQLERDGTSRFATFPEKPAA